MTESTIFTADIYQVDAFADGVFKGNPAAVVPLETWLPDATLQAIAAENNLAETAFVIKRGQGAYDLRWFTPEYEVDLCGHATLATAFALITCRNETAGKIAFSSREKGTLYVTRSGDQLQLDFPRQDGTPVAFSDLPENMLAALNGSRPPREAFRTPRDYYIVYDREADIATLKPDFNTLARLPWVCITAPGENCDFTSRFFTADSAVSEDPVTGSTHCSLAPYWARKLGKPQLVARQLSARGGTLHLNVTDDRVFIAGTAHLYMQGKIRIPAP